MNQDHAAVALFTQACKARGLKKPSSTLAALLSTGKDLDEVEDLPLDDVYLGTRGVMALLDVIAQAPNFRKLDLSAQKLYNSDLSPDAVKGNEVVDRVVEVVQAHPQMTALDLSHNPLSNFAGRKLLQLVNHNEKIVTIGLDNTRIDQDLLGHIHAKCEKNLMNTWTKQNESLNNDEPEQEQDFGVVSFQVPVMKAPTLTPLGGGMRKKTVMGTQLDPEKARKFVPKVYEKDPDEENMLVGLLSENLLFAHLAKDAIVVVARAMEKQVFNKGDTPIHEGDEGDRLYVVVTGSCSIVKKGQVVATKGKRGVFGELELMYPAPCAATVRVDTDTMVTFALDRETYAALVVSYSLRKREEYQDYLAKVEFLKTLTAYEKMQLSDALTTDHWQPEEYLIRYGDVGEWMFLVISGTVEVIGRDETGGERRVCEFKEGDHFGELEFLNNHNCMADVRAKTAVVTAKVNRRHFEMCFGPVLHVLKRNIDGEKYEYYASQLALADIKDAEGSLKSPVTSEG